METVCSRANVDDPRPLQLVIDFLKHGKRWEFDSDDTISSLPPERRVSVLFTLPTSLWTDTDDRTLVLNETMAIVFRVNKSGLQDLFAHHFETFGDAWAGAAMQAMIEKLDNNHYYYIKIRSTDTCMIRSPLAAMKTAESIIYDHHDLRLTYCLPFY